MGNEDTVLLILWRPVYICGNDERARKSEFRLQLERFWQNLFHPYEFDKNAFDTEYRFGDKCIITGESPSGGEGCYNCFSSKKVNLESGQTTQRPLFEIRFRSASENEAAVGIENVWTNASVTKTFAISDGKWTARN